MSVLGRCARKLAALLRRTHFASELEEEMSFHREQVEEELRAKGMNAQEARHAALRQFGNPTRLKERSEEVLGFQLEVVMLDARFALRQLVRKPGFAVTAIAILALGMGASAAIFGFVDAALIKPLPYGQPNGLVDVDEAAATSQRANLSYDDYQDWKDMNRSLSSLDVYTGMGYLLRMGSVSEPVSAVRVSDGFFRTLRVQPILGRDFRPGEDQPGQGKLVMLTYGAWQRRFGGRADVVGQSVNLSGDPYTIIGVLPRSFAFAPQARAEFWVPLLDKSNCEQRRTCHNLDGVGRLVNGVTVQAALADLKHVAADLAVQYPVSNQGRTATVQPLSEEIVGQVRPILLTLMAGASLLLLIACVNVAGLLLVRSESRRREIAVRAAIGATSARLIRQFVTEALLLSVAGCVGGGFLAGWLMVALRRLVPKTMADGMPFLANVGINAQTGPFLGGAALLMGLLLAWISMARFSIRDLHDGLSEGGRASAGRVWRRLGATLVAAELAVAVVLVCGAGLLGKSLYQLLRVDLGLNPEHLAAVNVMIPGHAYQNAAQLVALYDELQRRVGELPGVESVGITNNLPVGCFCDTDWIRIPGKPFHGEHNDVMQRDVSPAYMTTLQAKLLHGRLLTDSDDALHPKVILINETLARKYFPGEDPIGKMIGNPTLDGKSIRQIVGVIADVREAALDDNPHPTEYFSIKQGPDNFFSLVVRTAQDERAILPPLERTIRETHASFGVSGETTMADRIGASPAALLHQFSAWLIGGFAALALVLAVVGLYGVIAFSVSQRTREIGIRMALGAQPSAMRRLVLKEAGWLTGFGIVTGMVFSFITGKLMGTLLFQVQPWDVPTLAGVTGLLGVASLMASYLPARRAARLSPIEALRAE
jgi:macrolide transport system ATP-binding/permease protein